jgi:hypothetical protein
MAGRIFQRVEALAAPIPEFAVIAAHDMKKITAHSRAPKQIRGDETERE